MYLLTWVYCIKYDGYKMKNVGKRRREVINCPKTNLVIIKGPWNKEVIQSFD